MSEYDAFEEIGYRIEDGDIGYTGNAHLSFAFRALRSAALECPRPTPVGEAALSTIKATLESAKAARRAARERRAVRSLMESCV